MKKALTFVAALVAFVVSGAAMAQNCACESNWRLSMSAYIGNASPADLDMRTASPTYDLVGHSVRVNSVESYGIKMDLWNVASREKTGLDVGIGLDATSFRTTSNSQTVHITGTVGGQPIDGIGTTQKADFDTIFGTVNLLIRRPFGVSAKMPNGEWYPYAGYGIGVNNSSLSWGGHTQTKTYGATQALVGAAIFLTSNLAVFAEYKIMRAPDQEFLLGNERDEFIFKVRNFGFGAAYHFN